MAPGNNNDLMIENVRLIFRNFSGTSGPFNPGGKRTFCAVIEDEKIVQALIEDGWNVKYTKPRDEDDVPVAYLKINVNFGGAGRPPAIHLITSTNRTTLKEDTIDMLDWAEIVQADIEIRPYNWEMPNGDSGVTAYLKNAYFTINESELDRKYAQHGEEG